MGVVLVTGGGRGIGAAVCRRLAARGDALVLTYVSDAAAAEATAAACTTLGSPKVVTVRGDVASEADVLRMFAAADDIGPLTALVNNAGIVATQGRLETFDGARLTRVVEVNLLGTMLCAREGVRRMATSAGGSGGCIVNVSSRASGLGSPGEYVDYAAAKGGVDTFTIGLAREVASDGIRVNAVRPGVISTDIHAAGGEPGRVARVAPMVPMGRGGEADEVAAAILWLLSDEASYVTGALLDVSGGR